MEEDKYLKANYKNMYKNSWTVGLMFLNIRYLFNFHLMKMRNIRRYIYAKTLSETSLYGHQYTDPDVLFKELIINNKPSNRFFEAFFYELNGKSNIVPMFPFGEKINMDIFKGSIYHNPESLLEDFEQSKLDKLNTVLKDNEKMLDLNQVLYLHGYGNPKVNSVESIKRFSIEKYNELLEFCNSILENLLSSDLKPIYNKHGQYQLPKDNYKRFQFPGLIIKWLDTYPSLFARINKPNVNLCDNISIDEILATITLNHIPVFTNNDFLIEYNKDLVTKYIFDIKKSPGLMTSSIPNANKKIRELSWIKDTERKPVLFYNTGDNKGPPNLMIETYASPLNHNAEVFCSLFPSDRYVSGCIGKFDDNLIEKFKVYNWIPKVLFVNPPYTHNAITNANKITDNIHTKFPIISITTLSRRDGGVLTPLLKAYGNTKFETYKSQEASSLMNPMLNSKYLKDFIIVPEELFEYADLFTGNKMFTASRQGSIPTDTIILIKSSMDNSSHLEDIEKIIYDEIPKTKADKYRINTESQKDIITEVMRRSNLINVGMTEDLLKMIINDFNKAVS